MKPADPHNRNRVEGDVPLSPGVPVFPRQSYRPPPNPRARTATALIGVVIFLAAVPGLRNGQGRPLAVWAGLAVLCLLPGCGLVCWLPVRDPLTRALAVITASLTWSTLLTTALAERQLVTQGATFLVTAIPGVSACVAYLVGRPLLGYPLWAPAAKADSREGRGPRQHGNRITLRGIAPERVTAVTLVVIALLLWILSMLSARGHTLGDYGLFPLLGVPFVAAVIISVSSVVCGLAFNLRVISAAALTLLIVMLNGTAAALATTPLATWSYKHFGVVDYILRGGALGDPHDIYQQWPGFFAAAAGLVAMSGVSPLSYANWCQLFFELLNALVLFAIARWLVPRHKNLPYATVLLFVVSAWVGQRYYAPQSLAFLLTLLVQFFALPLIDTTRLRRPFARVGRKPRSRAIYGPLSVEQAPQPLAASQATAVSWALVGVFAAITVTHQLTPYILFGGLAGLWVVGVLRRPLFVAAMAVVLLLWLLPHLSSLGGIPLFTGFEFSTVRGAAVANAASPQALASAVTRPLAVTIWLGAALCVVSYRRRLFMAAIPAIMIAAPFGVVLMQSYGGEAIYRVALFSSPWCALIIAVRLADLHRFPALRWATVATWSVLAALASGQAQVFGQFTLFWVDPVEISASAYFLDHAPRGATPVLALASFPSRVNGRYVLHNATNAVNDPTLADSPDFKPSWLVVKDPRAFARTVEGLGGGNGYLVVAPSMAVNARYYGQVDPATLPRLVTTLRSSRYWKVWYDRDGIVIFEARP